MLRVIALRLSVGLATMFAAMTLIFVLFELDEQAIALNALGIYVSPEQIDAWLAANGYDAPAIQRYFVWLGDLLTGNVGVSKLYGQPILEVILSRLGHSAIIGGAFLAVVVPISLALGVISGMNENKPIDRVISALSVVTCSIPPFASAILVSGILVFWLKLLPGTSSMLFGFSPQELIMPVIVLALYDIGYVTRITRASVIQTVMSPFVRTAYFKGLPFHRVVWRHVMRNALVGPITVILLQINWLIGGIVVVEVFFAYKGFGSLVMEAALGKDLKLLEACVGVTVLLAVLTQTIADLAYYLLNPRLRKA